MNLGTDEDRDPEFRAILDQHYKNTRTDTQKAAKQTVLERQNQLKSSIKTILETEEGVFFFRWLCDFLGFKDNILRQAPGGDFLMKAILYLETRRNVWVDLRKYLTIQHRNTIEEDRDENI